VEPTVDAALTEKGTNPNALTRNSSPHDVNGKNTALMARQQIIYKIAND
jgi:hypothetical protein